VKIADCQMPIAKFQNSFARFPSEELSAAREIPAGHRSWQFS
jgi:hypothetical protein